MQFVNVDISVTGAYDAGDVVRFYGSEAGGEIDYGTVLHADTVELFAGSGAGNGWLLEPWLLTGWLGEPIGETPESVGCVAGPYYVGLFAFGAKVLDAAGNVSAAGETSLVVNSSPRAPRGIERGTYNAVSDVLTFAFTESRDLAA